MDYLWRSYCHLKSMTYHMTISNIIKLLERDMCHKPDMTMSSSYLHIEYIYHIISYILHEWRIKDVICKGDTESWFRECILYGIQTCSLRWLTKGILVHQTCICHYVCMCTSWREILCAGKQENILGKKIRENIIYPCLSNIRISAYCR